MKKFLIAAILAGIAIPSMAQHKHGQDYSVSVFRNNQPNSNRKAAAETNARAVQAFPKWAITVDNATGLIKDIYGPGISLPGSSLAEKTRQCMDKQLRDLGVTPSEWVLDRTTQNELGGWITYKQVLNGHDVAFSRLSFRFTADGRLVRIQMKNYGSPQATAPTLSMNQALDAALANMPGATVTTKSIKPEWAWFPVPSANGYDLHPAWAFNIDGTDGDRDEMKLRGFVDATDGTVLYRVNDVKFDYDLTVNSMVRMDGFVTPPSVAPLPHLRVTINGTNYFTDNLGFFADQGITLPQATTIPLRGRWSVVKDSPLDSIPVMIENVTTQGTTFTYPTTGLAQSQHINAYYHTNVVHDFMKSHYPTFTGLDIALPTNVDVNGNCNAFYNGNSINFYKAGGGCASFAEIGDVVYHEYGHGINDKFYDSVVGDGMENGALNEGYADVWAMCITDTPILGLNGIGNGFIRRYDGLPRKYPQDINGQVHNDGEIIAGAWWDTRLNIGNVDTMARIFAESLYDTPDGPEGTEGEVYHSALIAALMADDDDANILNGTPHFLEIVTAFAEHGIYLLSDAELSHGEMWNPIEYMDAPINATLQITYQPFLKDVQVKYRVRPATTWNTITMATTNSIDFTAQIPGQSRGSIIDYYFVVRDTLEFPDAYFPAGYHPDMPANRSNIPYQYGTHLMGQVYQNFNDNATDWVVGNFPGQAGLLSDNATSGKWVHAIPIGSYANGLPSQPNNDHTTGATKCLVTGNALSVNSAVGAADVDNGRTTVLSPLIDITNFDNPVIEYFRWYSNNRGSNPNTEQWLVRIGTPNSPIWYNVESTYVSDQSWRRRIFRVRDYISASNQIQLAFIAEDLANNGGAAVEAAIDDFLVYSTDWALGVENVTAPARATIFPNPSDQLVHVQLSNNSLANGSIGIYDLTGKKIIETPIENGKTDYEFSTRELASGTYFLLVKSDKMAQSQKLTVQH